MATEYNGINYFPVQTMFFEGSIQELLEAKFGIKGPYLMIQLLCKIYKAGYFLPWGDEQSLIFAHKLGREYAYEEVKEMISILLEKGFFDKQSYETHQVLTAEGIQRVWMEATNRRKRDLGKLPHLLIEIPEAKETNKCKQKGQLCEESADIFATHTLLNEENVDILAAQATMNEENADIFRQSKVKESKGEKRKELPPSTPPGGTEDEKTKDFLLSPPPEYALNTKTHNYQGLLDTLQRLKVTDPNEIKSILRLSNYGEKGKLIWLLLAKTRWEKIEAPGRYIIKSLRGG